MTLSSPNDAKFASIDKLDTFALPGECIESGEVVGECRANVSSPGKVVGEWRANVSSPGKVVGEWRANVSSPANFQKWPFWRVLEFAKTGKSFGEYSKSTNSPASGHCLGKT
jgi:hypothetical protein